MKYLAENFLDFILRVPFGLEHVQSQAIFLICMVLIEMAKNTQVLTKSRIASNEHGKPSNSS